MRGPTVLVALLLGVVLVLPPTPANASSGADVARELSRLVNGARGAQGLATLGERPDLIDVAARWSSRMASDGVLRHNPDYGAQVCCWEVVTENVGMASVSSADDARRLAERLHEGFMGSSSHRTQVLDARVTEIGVGAVFSDGAVWVTVLFRLPEASVTSPGTATSGAGSDAGSEHGTEDGPATATPRDDAAPSPGSGGEPAPSASDPEPTHTSAATELARDEIEVLSSTYDGRGARVAAAFHGTTGELDLAELGAGTALTASTGAVRFAAGLLVASTGLLVLTVPGSLTSRRSRRT